jgi:hypothetical protein
VSSLFGRLYAPVPALRRIEVSTFAHTAAPLYA